MHTYPWHVGDFLKDCAHLSDMEELAYRRLIDLYYTQEAPIPNRTQWVAKRIRMVGQEVLVGSVLREFFKLEGSGVDGLWRQKRCDAEISKYQKRVDANRKNGVKGGRKPTGHPNDNPLGSKPRTRTRTNKSPLTPEGVDAEHFEHWFETEFWATYPRKVGKPVARKAVVLAVGSGKVTLAKIMAGLHRHIGCAQWQDQTKIPHPSTWLNREGWNDEVATPPAGQAGDPAAWWLTGKGILDRGIELGIPAPAAGDPQAFIRFKAEVWLAAGDGAWIDQQDTAYPHFKRLQNGAA